MEFSILNNDLYEKVRLLKRELNYLDKMILQKRKISFDELIRNKEILKLKRKAEEIVDDSYQFELISDKIKRLEESSFQFDDFDVIYEMRDKLRAEIDEILIEICDRKLLNKDEKAIFEGNCT